MRLNQSKDLLINLKNLKKKRAYIGLYKAIKLGILIKYKNG